MIRYYCDVCGEEIIPKPRLWRLKAEKGRVQVEVLVAVDGAWNHGHVCERCLLDVLNTGTRLDRDGEPVAAQVAPCKLIGTVL